MPLPYLTDLQIKLAFAQHRFTEVKKLDLSEVETANQVFDEVTYIIKYCLTDPNGSVSEYVHTIEALTNDLEKIQVVAMRTIREDMKKRRGEGKY